MFEVQHMGFSLQRGTFSKATGKITLDRAAKKGAIDVTIDTTTVKTIDPRLDTHVRGEDFFNVAKYPTMTFKSSQLSFDGDRVVGADGELTMLGITKPVKLTVANFWPARSRYSFITGRTPDVVLRQWLTGRSGLAHGEFGIGSSDFVGIRRDTALPDGGRTNWAAISREEEVDAGRYVQVRAELWSNNPLLSPALNEVGVRVA